MTGDGQKERKDWLSKYSRGLGRAEKLILWENTRLPRRLGGGISRPQGRGPRSRNSRVSHSWAGQGQWRVSQAEPVTWGSYRRKFMHLGTRDCTGCTHVSSSQDWVWTSGGGGGARRPSLTFQPDICDTLCALWPSKNHVNFPGFLCGNGGFNH